MLVAELIDVLYKLDQSKRIVIKGYEGDVNDIEVISHIPIRLNQNTAWYYGKHEAVMESDEHIDEHAYLIT